MKDVESWSFLAGSSLAELLIVRGTGNTYDGGGNTDTLYADWSSATNAITWVNAPSTTQVVNGNTLSDIERMLVTTGSGNDKIDNSYTGNNTNDYIDTGTGNDTIKGGTGVDTLYGGSGDDVISIFDQGLVDGGIGYDTVTISSIYQPYNIGHRWVSNAVAADWSTSYAGVSALLSAGTSYELQFHNSAAWFIGCLLYTSDAADE